MKNHRCEEPATLYLVALLAVGLFQGLSGDALLFYSDAFSYTYVTFALVLLAFLAAAAAGLVLNAALPGRWTQRMRDGLWMAVVVLVCAGFLVFTIESVSDVPSTGVGLGLTLVAGLICGVGLVARIPEPAVVRRQVERVALACASVGLAVVAAGLLATRVWEPARTWTSEKRERHAVLVVLDGMPSHLLRSYNPAAEETEFDRVLRGGLVFTAARTNKVYTNGFFGVLLSGRTDLGGEPGGGGSPRPHNLLGLMQQHGVATRWLSFHSNGIPESNRITHYSGLRSAFLTEHWSWLPSMLGLNYHTFIAWNDTRRGMGPRVEAIYRFLNEATDEETLWGEHIPRQIVELHARHRASLFIIHLSFGKDTVQTLAENPAVASTLREFYERAVREDYRYQPRDEAVMQWVREEYRRRADEYGRRIQALLGDLDRRGWRSDTLVMVTADHGSILSQGKIWYGYHQEEEVTRVPLLVFAQGLEGTDRRLVDTRDLTQTLLEYFGIDHRFDGDAASVLSPGRRNGVVPVLTIPSSRYREQFLCVYAGGRKYVVNIHPEGDGQSWWGDVDGYAVTRIHRPIASADPAWDMVGRSLAQFKLPPGSVHPKYRALLMQGAGNRSAAGIAGPVS